MSPIGWIAFVAAGAIGAPVRYLIDGVISDRARGTFPWGTFTINTTGSLLLGFLTGLALYHGFPDTPKLVFGTGFCGAYTTFSTHTFETVRLIEDGTPAGAARNALGTLVAGTAAAAIGLALAAL
jgi:fluoride exporter